MPPYHLRPATEIDSPIIRKMIIAAQINPTGLDWARFVVAISPEDKVIGCGQIKPHRDGSQELASLVVAPEYQGQGIARQIIEHLLDEHDEGPLYLMCQSSLGSLYKKFGFRGLEEDEMPKYFRRISKLVSFVEPLRQKGEGLLVMGRD